MVSPLHLSPKYSRRRGEVLQGSELGLKRIVRIIANNRMSLNRTNIFRGSNSKPGSARFIFSDLYRNFATSHTARARWPLDRGRQNASNRPTQPGGSYRLPVVLNAALFLLFLTDQRKRATTYPDRWHSGDSASGALFENATASPGFCCNLRLQTCLKLNFAFFTKTSLVIPRISKAIQ